MSDQDIESALSKVLRKHQRKLFGHCRCGWKPDLMAYLHFQDHNDHVARILSDVIRSVYP